jgi:hypothetical protein
MRCLFVIAALCSTSCVAMKTNDRGLEDAIGRARLAVVVEIAAMKYEENPMWRVLALQAAPLKTLFGKPVTAPVLNCRYSEGRAHLRGETRISPLVTGSGMEFSIKPKDRIILLIADEDPGNSGCEVLRIESLENVGAITQRSRQARGTTP